MSVIVGIRFKEVGKIYYFDPRELKLKTNDGVIVETARGLEYGTVVIDAREVDDDSVIKPLKPVLRIATEADEEKLVKNRIRAKETIPICEIKTKDAGLDMKIVDAEYTFDAQKLIIYFTADGRVDFRELVRVLASIFKVRIELRQIGIRDEAKLVGGIGPCGRPICCSTFLGDFEKVSIKMAKNQGLSLNPTKISGLCGRLMCCLAYENKHYVETGKLMPKINSNIETPAGIGKVISNDMVKRIVTVRMENGDSFENRRFTLEEINGKMKSKSQDQAEIKRKEEDRALLKSIESIAGDSDKSENENKNRKPRNQYRKNKFKKKNQKNQSNNFDNNNKNNPNKKQNNKNNSNNTNNSNNNNVNGNNKNSNNKNRNNNNTNKKGFKSKKPNGFKKNKQNKNLNHNNIENKQ